MNASLLLGQARDALGSSARDRSRIACWLTRPALEQVVRDLLVAKRRDPGEANMASLLVCLQIAYIDSPAVAEHADFAWAQLSNACHQHAFELNPTAAEAARLIDLVSELDAASSRL